jgi:phage gp36-like protein
MVYSTFESVNSVIDLTILKQLLNDENRQDEDIDLTDSNDPIVIRFNQLVAEVAEEIDNSLRGSYKLPLTKSSNTIQSLSDDRVVYNAKKRRLRDSISQSEQNIYDDGTKQLKAIRQGDFVLDLDPISSETVGYAGEIRVNKTPSDRIFNKDMWNKF